MLWFPTVYTLVPVPQFTLQLTSLDSMRYPLNLSINVFNHVLGNIHRKSKVQTGQVFGRYRAQAVRDPGRDPGLGAILWTYGAVGKMRVEETSPNLQQPLCRPLCVFGNYVSGFLTFKIHSFTYLLIFSKQPLLIEFFLVLNSPVGIKFLIWSGDTFCWVSVPIPWISKNPRSLPQQKIPHSIYVIFYILILMSLCMLATPEVPLKLKKVKLSKKWRTGTGK